MTNFENEIQSQRTCRAKNEVFFFFIRFSLTEKVGANQKQPENCSYDMNSWMVQRDTHTSEKKEKRNQRKISFKYCAQFIQKNKSGRKCTRAHMIVDIVQYYFLHAIFYLLFLLCNWLIKFKRRMK